MFAAFRLRSLLLLGTLALAAVPAHAASPAKQIDQSRAALAAHQPAAAESLAALARTALAKQGRPDSLALARADALIARARLERGTKSDSLQSVAAIAAAERLDRTVPKADLDAVRALETAGLVREQAGDKKAADWLGRAVARRSASGIAPDTAFVTLLRRQSRMEYARRAWPTARMALEQALAVQAAAAAVDLEALSDLHHDLTVVGTAAKTFPMAVAHLDTAMRLITQRGGDRDSGLVTLLLEQSRLFNEMEQVTLGMAPAERALGIARDTWGPDDDRTLLVQGTVASRYLTAGDPERGREALTDVERRLAAKPKPDLYKLSGIRYSLTGTILALGDTAAAMPYLEKSMRGYETLGRTRESPYLVMMNALGRWWRRHQQPARADSIFRTAIALDRGRPGSPSSMTATLYGGWFEVLDDRGDWYTIGRTADSLVKLFDGTPLATSFGMARSLRWQMFARMHEGRNDLARVVMRRWVPMERGIVNGYVRRLPDRAALAFESERGDAVDLMLAIASPDDPTYTRYAWGELARWRGMVRHELGLRQLASEASSDTAIAAAHARWADAQNAYGGLAVAGAPPAELREARRRAEDTRRKWVIAVATRAPDVPDDSISAERLERALEPGQALVAYAGVEVAGEKPRMVAFVWRAGAPEPRLVTLGARDSISGPIDAWETLLRAPEDGRTPTASDERAARTAGARVRALVWAPLAKEVGDAREVFVVPSGPLLDLRWPALPWDSKRYWAEAGPVMRVLNAERELLAPPLTPAAGGLLALGGIDYEQGNSGMPLVAARFRAARPDCRDGKPPRFEPLPESAREVSSIAGSWPRASGAVRLLEGRDATEQSFFDLAHGYRVIHIATHGYVPQDTCGLGAPGLRGIGGVSAVQASAPGGVTAKSVSAADKPPFGHGPDGDAGVDSSSVVWLAFTGADRAVSHEDPAGDGLLTPEEAMTLDLTGTDWVVLSACYSTRGRDTWAREGLTGMRRAFHMAGARTVVGSSWAVGDQAGAEWMTALYAARAAGAHSAGEAIQKACASVLAERRKAGRSTHPFNWASFTATGE